MLTTRARNCPCRPQERTHGSLGGQKWTFLGYSHTRIDSSLKAKLSPCTSHFQPNLPAGNAQVEAKKHSAETVTAHVAEAPTTLSPSVAWTSPGFRLQRQIIERQPTSVQSRDKYADLSESGRPAVYTWNGDRNRALHSNDSTIQRAASKEHIAIVRTEASQRSGCSRTVYKNEGGDLSVRKYLCGHPYQPTSYN